MLGLSYTYFFNQGGFSEMNYNLDCDGVDVCLDGSFDCENCSLVRRQKQSKPIIKKPKQSQAPQKQFKRRKK